MNRVEDYISVLERGDMNSPRYRSWLEQRQALEGSYPLEDMFTLGGGRLIKGAFNFVDDIGRRAYNTADLAMRPNITHMYKPPFLKRDRDAYDIAPEKYLQRYLRDPRELDDIIKSGYMRADPTSVNPRKFYSMEGGGQPTNWVPTNTPQRSVRIPLNRVPDGKAIRSRDVQLQNRETGIYEPLPRRTLMDMFR